MMTQMLSDKELLSELELRFDKNKRLLQEQFSLMTQLKVVNERLLISEELKSNFLSNIRNEINNPLASILEMSKNIAEGSLDMATMQKFARLIYGETFNLDFQLRNIFASAEIEAGEAVAVSVSVNIRSLIENVVASFRHQMEKKNITCTINNLQEGSERFCSDPEKLHLVLSNLICNATQFNEAGGKIEIHASIENRQLIITVKDNGPGIDEHDRGIIFDRFRQLHEGSTKAHGGHGLGLSIARALMELLEGSIELRSEKGKGSEFSICVTESENSHVSDDIFSSEGNDFMFTDPENLAF